MTDTSAPTRSSLLSRTLGAHVLITLVFAASWIWSLNTPLEQAVTDQQEKNLAAVAKSASVALNSGEPALDSLVTSIVKDTDMRVTVVASDGTVLADSRFDITRMENHLDRPEIAAALAGEESTAERDSETASDRQLYHATPARLDGQRIAVRVSQPVSDIKAIAANVRRSGLLLLAVALALAAFIAFRGARAVTTPVAELARAAARVGSSEPDHPSPVVPAELAPIARALDGLREEVGRRMSQLEDERSDLKSVLDGLGDAVFLVEEGVISFANKSASTLFREPVNGWTGTNLATSTLPAGVRYEIGELLENGETIARDLAPLPTGTTYRLLVHPQECDHGTRRSIVVISDITERATLDRVRSDFVANASHELKTPAAAISLLSESLRMALEDGDAESIATFASRIGDESTRLRNLVSDLLDLSRLENSLPASDLTDARDAVERVIVSHAVAAESRGIRLEADLADITGIDVFIVCDSTDLAIALDNLVDNAVTHTTSGSVTVSVSATPRRVAIRVADTGEGIEQEHVARIFERFYRVDPGRARKDGGTGLGLSLVRNAVERNGGNVTLERTSKNGSTFLLDLPRA